MVWRGRLAKGLSTIRGDSIGYCVVPTRIAGVAHAGSAELRDRVVILVVDQRVNRIALTVHRPQPLLIIQGVSKRTVSRDEGWAAIAPQATELPRSKLRGSSLFYKTSCSLNLSCPFSWERIALFNGSRRSSNILLRKRMPPARRLSLHTHLRSFSSRSAVSAV